MATTSTLGRAGGGAAAAAVGDGGVAVGFGVADGVGAGEGVAVLVERVGRQVQVVQGAAVQVLLEVAAAAQVEAAGAGVEGLGAGVVAFGGVAEGVAGVVVAGGAVDGVGCCSTSPLLSAVGWSAWSSSVP